MSEYRVVSPQQYDHCLGWIGKSLRHRGRQQSFSSGAIKNVIIAFDIETTRLTPDDLPSEKQDQSIMYLWAIHFHTHLRSLKGSDAYTIIGRTWDELSKLFQEMNDDLKEDERAVIWVHNLSYEFQFLRHIYNFSPDEVFCLKDRKILRAMMGRLEFRCSYLHSNMSLAQYAKKMGAEHGKLSGDEFDYTKKRYPWTPITPLEERYMLHDVWGLAESLQIEMQTESDTLHSIPATSTGYVRRDAKKAMYDWAREHRGVVAIEPDLYGILREAFRGGDTHANRLYAGRIICDVKSADRSSSYPDVQCNHQFPATPFVKRRDFNAERLASLLARGTHAAIFRVSFEKIRLRDPFWGFPYLSKDKASFISGGLYDNGRVMAADVLDTAMTDVDLEIVLEQYVFDTIAVWDVYTSVYGALPDEFTSVVKGYYRMKTELKNVRGQELYYEKAKNKLNSLYGMSAQDIAKQTVKFREDLYDTAGRVYAADEEDIEDILRRSNRKAFQSYAWGVWVTAWARWELQQGLKLCGHNAVYCDTDSCKYIGEVDWSQYNDERIKRSVETGSYADDPQGVRHYMGVFEQEQGYAEFATLGAKKYAYRYERGGCTHVTIAGVTKSKGGAELDKGDEYGSGLERFLSGSRGRFDELHVPPFTFRDAGGVEAIYNDSPDIRYYEVDGHTLEVGPNVVLRPSEYTLGSTAEYENLLRNGLLPLQNWIADRAEEL